MIIIESPLKEKDYKLALSLKKILFEENTGSLLVLDIETTGLSSYAFIYMLGFICIDDNPRLIQWFAEKPEDEYQMLYKLKQFINCFDKILTYNGNNFDIPFIKKRMSFYNLHYLEKQHDMYDLFQDIKPYKAILKLDNLKQKTLELQFGINREDLYNGKELISVYKEYLNNKSDDLKQLLLLHNSEDILGLLELSQFYAYIRIIELIKNESLPFKDINAKTFKDNLEINIIFDNKIFSLITYPEVLLIDNSMLHIDIHNKGITLSIPLITETMYYFFDDYNNYYYLPEEDMAIHKSVAQFVQKGFKKRATPKNAYIKKRGIFIPLYKTNELFSEFKQFKKSFSQSEIYLEYNPNLLDDYDFIKAYASNLLNYLNIRNFLIKE